MGSGSTEFPVRDAEVAVYVEKAHQVKHAFGARVVVGPIGQVREGTVGIVAGLKAGALRDVVAVEELLEGTVNLGVGVGAGVAWLG